MRRQKKSSSIYRALKPCLKSECELWRDGECIQIRKVVKEQLKNYAIFRCNALGFCCIEISNRVRKIRTDHIERIAFIGSSTTPYFHLKLISAFSVGISHRLAYNSMWLIILFE